MSNPRRSVPRTDAVLADARLVAAIARLGRARVKEAVVASLSRVRSGELDAALAADDAVRALPDTACSMRTVLNATGVVLHTNLGRAPLSDAALMAVAAAGGYVDVEFELDTGARARRGRGALEALRLAVPDAGDVLLVNNGAAALVLATTALAAGRDVIVSRGEMVEIGDGFRLPELIASTGARLREVGTTNRVTVNDYADAITPSTGCILKVHPSNFRIEGFTSSVPVEQLRQLGVPVVADIGSGLLAPHPLLPAEPDAATTLRAGATVVTCSADKLLGGPQGGLVLGEAAVIEQLRRHPLARALRVDKLTLAALEVTLTGPPSPAGLALRADADDLRRRCEQLIAGLHLAGLLDSADADVVPADGAVGGGSAPGVRLPGWAIALPAWLARPLRLGQPAVVSRVEHDRCLLDLRCVPPADDEAVLAAVLAALSGGPVPPSRS